MRLELYEAECRRIADDCQAMLDDASRLLAEPNRAMSALEQAGMLHALQVLIENAIGKAKQALKASGHEVPVSAYDAFAAMAHHRLIASSELQHWNAIVGLRNRIVHDYMNVDMSQVSDIVCQGRYQFVLDFLRRPIS
jgi:uncharacterized protein YutE (UPF0331/DUF86 family)